jgi:hypothetical protein
VINRPVDVAHPLSASPAVVVAMTVVTVVAVLIAAAVVTTVVRFCLPIALVLSKP